MFLQNTARRAWTVNLHIRDNGGGYNACGMPFQVHIKMRLISVALLPLTLPITSIPCNAQSSCITPMTQLQQLHIAHNIGWVLAAVEASKKEKKFTHNQQIPQITDINRCRQKEKKAS